MKMKYQSVKEMATRWNVSERSVRNYCALGKIPGAFLTGKTWNIPNDAQKPTRKNQKKNRPQTLLEILQLEKKCKLSGGIYHQIQIDFTYNSNHMEGSCLSHEQTRFIFETNTVDVEGKVVKVDDIILEQTEYTINVDEAVDVPFTFTPDYAINAEFEWTTENPEIVRVWGNRFRGLKKGEATVIVKTLDGTVERKIKVIVKDPQKVEDILLNQTEYTIYENQAVDIPFDFTPVNATNAEFEWTVKNPEIVRVWGNRIRGLKEGKTEVIVKTLDGTVEKRIPVTVKKGVNVQDITLNQTEYTVKVNEAVDIPFEYAPDYAINAEFEWTTENPEIIRVWGNRFRALKEGTAKVIVRTLDGSIEKQINVTVTK